jgi:shikimate 5-dehydrogenase
MSIALFTNANSRISPKYHAKTFRSPVIVTREVSNMRVVLVGSGGVGDAFARIAARRDFFERLVVADYDLSRAERTAAAVQERHPGEDRFVAAHVGCFRRRLSGVAGP